jgi:hypothetical protein
MATAARKARKRSGEKFTKTAKVGTPLEERRIEPVFDRTTGGFHPSHKAYRRIKDAIDIRDGVNHGNAERAAE